MPHFPELLYKRSTSGRRGNCKWRETTILKHNIEYTYYVSGERTCGPITRRQPPPAALSDLYASAFNALPWIIYTQIEMSHSCRSSCLSALGARRSAPAPSLLLYSAPRFVLPIGFTFYRNHWARFWKAKLNGVPIDFHIALFKKVKYNVSDRKSYSRIKTVRNINLTTLRVISYKVFEYMSRNRYDRIIICRVSFDSLSRAI